MLISQKNTLLIATFLLCLPLSVFAQKKQKGTPQAITLEAGKTYTYRYLTEGENEISMMGMQVTTDTKNEKVYSYEVLEVDAEGLAKVRMRLVSVVNNMENNIQGKQEYDSKKAASKPHDMARYDAWLVGKDWHVFIDKFGKAQRTEGYTEVRDAMLEEVTFKGETGVQIKASLVDNYSEQAIMNQATEAFGSFPRRELKKGDNWKEKQVDEFVGDRVFTVEEANQSEIRYKMVRNMVPNKKAKATRNSSGISVLNKMSGKQEQVSTFDARTRLLLKRVLTQKAEGEVQMSGGAIGNNPMDVPTKQTTRSVLERIDN